MFNVWTPGWPFLVGGEVDCEWETKGKRCILFDVNSELKLSQMSRPCKLISGTAEFNPSSNQDPPSVNGSVGLVGVAILVLTTTVMKA